MLVASELKGELARIQPARACCRRAELAGLLHADTARRPRSARGARSSVDLVTLDPATARTAVQLAAALGAAGDAREPAGRGGAHGRHLSSGRQRLRVAIDPAALAGWSWAAALACDRRAFIRGTLLSSGSLSFTPNGLHVEFVFRERRRAAELRRRLAESDVRSAIAQRRGRSVVYIKGRDEVATLLRLTGANRGLLELETSSVGREVRSRLNRLLNAEQANLGRTLAAARRQLDAIDSLEERGVLGRLSTELRHTSRVRRQHPDADLDALAAALGVTRSAVNHRLRRLRHLADDAEVGASLAARGRRGENAARRR
ncbi:MAG: DNA-binding protein WhiA [Candidatus Limnocylindria bacterium]